jgi:hypothetical protein
MARGGLTLSPERNLDSDAWRAEAAACRDGQRRDGGGEWDLCQAAIFFATISVSGPLPLWLLRLVVDSHDADDR